MSKRNEHTFQFKASQIRDAARAEAEYHEGRERHWRALHHAAAERVLMTSSVKLAITSMTGGDRISVVVDPGDPAAYAQLQESYGRAESHRVAAERYRTDEQVYGSQALHPEHSNGDRMYELDTDDVHHFRLGGQARED